MAKGEKGGKPEKAEPLDFLRLVGDPPHEDTGGSRNREPCGNAFSPSEAPGRVGMLRSGVFFCINPPHPVRDKGGSLS